MHFLRRSDKEIIAWIEAQNIAWSVNDALAELTRRRTYRMARWTLVAAFAAAAAAIASALDAWL